MKTVILSMSRISVKASFLSWSTATRQQPQSRGFQRISILYLKSAGDPTNQLSDSLVSSRPQGGSDCSGDELLKIHSWHSCTPLLRLVALVRLAASASPHPPLARDAVWGSLLRCCCCEPANPAHAQTLTHKP